MTREDQKRINAFGRLNNRLHDVSAELEGKKARAAAARSLARGASTLALTLVRARRSCWRTWRRQATSCW